jgi:hypothetical protein
MESLSINSAMLSTMSLSFAFIMFGMAKTSNAQTSTQFENDCEQLLQVNNFFYKETYGIFNRGGEIAEYMALHKKISTINELALAPAEKALADFKKKFGKYGMDTNSLSKLYSEMADNEKRKITSAPQYGAYNQLTKSILDYKENVLAEGDGIAQSVQNVHMGIIEYREDPQEITDLFRDAMTLLNIALQFNPNSAKAKEVKVKLDALKKEKLKLIEESRKTARMPAIDPGFRGNAAEVVKKALEFINAKNKGSKENYFMGSIASPWFERKDAFGNTIDCTIQINIGYQTQGEPANLMHVYQAILYTCGKKPEAPFCKSGSVMGWEFAMYKENLGK